MSEILRLSLVSLFLVGTGLVVVRPWLDILGIFVLRKALVKPSIDANRTLQNIMWLKFDPF